MLLHVFTVVLPNNGVVEFCLYRHNFSWIKDLREDKWFFVTSFGKNQTDTFVRNHARFYISRCHDFLSFI